MAAAKTNHEQVSEAVNNLLRVARRNGVYVAGFAFKLEGAPGETLLTNFGNCSDAHELKLFTLLCELCERKRKRGEVNTFIVGEVS